MKLKNYQQNSLKVLKNYFEKCRIVGHEEAFKQITSDGEIAARLVNLKNTYTAWKAIPDTPRVCIKVPTGGGKTIIAAHAIKIVSQTWCDKEYPLVLWFVPSDTIRRQTAEALKNHRHPYREALNEQFEGKVQIFDLDEKFNIRHTDVAKNACIIVSTMQSFVKANTDKYNVYKDNENLESHFVKMPSAKYMGMEICDAGVRPKYSFSNLLYFHKPIMIVDEAHKVVTELSQETQQRINPAAIIEFTATPQPNNNTLYNVRAFELKEEEMIKLPIALVEHFRWEQAVDEAIARRAALEKDADNEKEYIRPILLFQAQSKDKDVTVEVLKNYLVETVGLPETQIKIATGEQKELDDIDLFNPDEPTRYIITVEALKEGWDCSFAYVLCSLSNIKSDTSVEQLLGRVMRMPYAKSRNTPSLNKAYAYVVSPHFGEAASALIEQLSKKGFDDDEALSSIQQETPVTPDLDPNWNTPFNAFTLKIKIDKNELPASIDLDNKNTLFFTPKTTEADIKTVCDKISLIEAASLQWKYNNFKRTETEKSPADNGEIFKIPRLMVELDRQLLFADPDVIFEHFDWDIGKYAPTKLEKSDFNINETPGKGFHIDIDGSRLTYSIAGKDQLLPYLADIDIWQPINLVHWLDRNLKQDDIPQSQMVAWLCKVVDHLMETRKIAIPNLMITKFALLNKLHSIIAQARTKARTTSFELFQRTARKELDFDTGFEFKKGMYDMFFPYHGKFKFTKHFLGNNNIPSIDGGENGEEFQCAKTIDTEPQVEYWLRNIARHTASFRLPTSTDYFYPDFTAKLNDGRILVVEYKGEHIASNNDTKEKEAIGLIWEKESKGQGLFLLAVKSKDGKTVEQQIKEKINKI
jgi:type III restriction enzyme